MELFILPAALRLGSVGVAGRKLHFHFAFLSFHFSPLGSSASHLPGFLHFSPGEGHRPRILAEENYPGLFSHFLSLNPVLKWQRITRIPTDGGVNTTEIGKKGPEERCKGVIGFSELPFAFSETTLRSRGTAISWTSVSASSWPAPYVLVITTLKEFVIVKWIWHFTPDCFQKKTWEILFLALHGDYGKLCSWWGNPSLPDTNWPKYIIYQHCSASSIWINSRLTPSVAVTASLFYFFRGLACDIRTIRGLCSSALPMTDMCLGHGRFRDLTPEPSRAWC